MAKKELPPLTEREIRALIHQIIKRMILLGLALSLLGIMIIAAISLWQNG